jgi:hypothetical protein
MSVPQIGVLLSMEECSPSLLPSWIVEMLQQIHDAGAAHLSGIVRQNVGTPVRRERLDPFWWWVQARSSVPDALACTALDFHADAFCSLSELMAKEVDILLLLGAEVPAGISAPIVWSLEAATPHQVDECTVRVLLRQVQPSPKLIACSHVSTEPTSARLGTNRRLWKAAGLIPRALEHLNRTGELPVPVERESLDGRGWTKQKEGRGGALPALLRRFNQKLRPAKQWSIGLHPGQASPESLSSFVHLDPPKGLHWADPFLVENEDRFHLFLEEVSTSRLLGRISVVEVDHTGMLGEPKPVIVEDFHLSYPCLFRAEGELWMVPEAARSGGMRLYRCHRFPDVWHYEKEMMSDVYALDPTIVEIDGLWWMFVTIRANRGAPTTEDLSLFFAESPLGPWHPHRQGLIRSTPRGARSAGRPFCRSGTWYRPAQDCRGGYGRGVIIQKIEELTTDSYRETEVGRWGPEGIQGADGLHTLNFSERMTVVDFRSRIPRKRVAA